MNMEKPIIGLDFGNYNSFVCYISDFDAGTRMGGNVHDLLPGGLNNGIPSVFFYSTKNGILCGEDAVRTRAKPVKNRLRYLKRHLGEKICLDDKTILYDDAITEVIQHCVRRANEQLQLGWQITTNLIALSYPATYTFAQKQRLIECAQKATLVDGTKVKVYGTIAEPAAAALDYLAEFAKTDKDTTILTYDLGGGTFDLALVSAYPAGKKNANGDTYYYDIINTRGLPKVGGSEFDDIMYKLLSDKFNVPLKPAHKDSLKAEAEKVKIDLSSDLDAEPELFYNDEYISTKITRTEFEAASRELLMKTINETREILRVHPNQQPEIILLTGGASQMPMVMKEMEAAFPQFKGKIKYFRPSKAIAYGAARFGTAEGNTDISKKSMVQQRVMYDIGIRYYKNYDDENNRKLYISTEIPAGTPIPYNGEYKPAYTVDKGRYLTFRVFEANKQKPNEENISGDYIEIMSVTIDFEVEVPKDTKSESRLIVDSLGLLMIEAREYDKPGKPPVKNSVELKNLS